MPKFSMPKFSLPASIEMPEFSLPEFSLPEFSLPEFSLPMSTGVVTPAAAATATAVVVTTTTTALLLLLRQRRMKRREARATDAARKRREGCETIRLLPSENSFVIKTTPPISSITFFEAETPEEVEMAKQIFRARTAEIVEANPWLEGFLDVVDDGAGNLALFVPPKHSEKNDDSSNDNSNNSNPPFAVLNTLGPIPDDYHSMVRALGPALIGNTMEHVASLDGASWEPLWKVAFVPPPPPPTSSKDENENENENGKDKDSGNDDSKPYRFGIVVSANHSLLDGHGYYKILNMLSCKEPIVALSPLRKHDLGEAIDTATGSEPSLLERPPLGFILSFIISTIRNAIFPQTKSIGFVLSKSWIEEKKASYAESLLAADKEDGNKDKDKVLPPPKPPFVSTNDLVVSEFCKEIKCDLALMSINLRGRVEGCTEDLVGNYEYLLAYTKGDSNDPSKIRESVTGPVYQRVGAAAAAAAGSSDSDNPLPTSWEHLMGCTYAAITSWSTFAKELVVSSAIPTIRQSLHVPLFDFPKASPACTYCSMVIFRPRKGETAVLCCGKTDTMERLAANRMFGSLLFPVSY